jgi:hypothetical protein
MIKLRRAPVNYNCIIPKTPKSRVGQFPQNNHPQISQIARTALLGFSLGNPQNLWKAINDQLDEATASK